MKGGKAEVEEEEEEEMGEDRISSLPDDILLNNILSLLPTKTSVTTACLSQRNFAVLVNGVLAFLHNPCDIQKFRLDCAHTFSDDKFREYSVDTWVRAAIGPHLQELNLNLYTEDYGPGYKLPLSLFTSTNLVSLSLYSAIHVHMQNSMPVTLPSLKMLVESPILGWPPQPSVPNCLVSHLTFIQFKGFRGIPDEVSFIDYLLRNGLVLKTMIVADISLDLKMKYHILKLLSDVPRASGMCQLKFD
ncbi:F-box/FBD/LRR-repeat protein [Trifolium pratense]|uniref:F-box/FBD/LRR-repeat protein n=1 Tax=Trifolium pratense TaxID=57577 RepID=A0A2K3NE48_TRIPR|nr:F-box/FBD/LRR-repeat protein [Trifolium pratense]